MSTFKAQAEDQVEVSIQMAFFGWDRIRTGQTLGGNGCRGETGDDESEAHDGGRDRERILRDRFVQVRTQSA